MNDTTLPVASPEQVRAEGRRLVRRHRRPLSVVVATHVLAAAAGLAGPVLLGLIVDAVIDGASTARINALVGALALAIVIQTWLVKSAVKGSLVLSETVFAELRENFLHRVLRVPTSKVERAGTGDLVSRATTDMEVLAHTVRFAAPEVFIATLTTFLIMVAAFLTAPLVAAAAVLGVPLMWAGTWWYLRRARQAYLHERSAHAQVARDISETVEGASTVEALNLSEVLISATDRDIEVAYRAERRTLFLRSVWYPVAELAYVLPIAATVGWGAWLASHGHVTVGQVTTVVGFMILMLDPFDRLTSWVDELQLGASALSRVKGLENVPTERTESDAEPASAQLRAEHVHYAYVDGQDVLHGISLELRKGERLAVVGPSGAGKTTLGRLLAGFDPPRTGRIEVGGVPLVDLSSERLRREVVLVTQEHHVFVGTVRYNLLLAASEASDDELLHALDTVGATEWLRTLPAGLDTVVGSGGRPVGPTQAQQLALARIVLADPHTLILDEATSLLDPEASRDLELSLAAVLSGRTVIVIAHRLDAAAQADRVAVLQDGRVTELGAHAELLAANGAYAALWASWQGSPQGTDEPNL